MFQPRSLKNIATLTSVQCYKSTLKPCLIFENSLFFHAKVAYSAVFREKKRNVRSEHVHVAGVGNAGFEAAGKSE